ncbi:MAG: methyltransferase domain-containing protein [Methanomicrobiales archaeon]|nr:methyltransferase domain-containing protein [Methanomicrobiales archaeon]MDI6876918.1 methyltransferase domain-containing protein [Methanomicrobiales archaeon]
MDDAPFEIRDDEINVEEIMEKIRENIRRRKAAGIYPPDPDSLVTPQASAGSSTELARDLAYISGNWNIQNNSYFISSHRPVAGKVLVKGRELVHGEVRRYVDPVIWKQAEFNRATSQVLRDAAHRLSGVEDRIREFDDRVRELDSLLQQLRDDTSKQIKEVIKELRSQIGRQPLDKEQIKECESKDIRKAGWAKFYDHEITHEELEGNINHHKEFISLIEEYAHKSAQKDIPKLLEVGIGTATMSIYFSEMAFEVVGIDNDISIIYEAFRTNDRLGGYAKFLLMDIMDLNMLKPKYFDVAFSQGTMEHFDNETISKILERQLLVSNYVIFSVPSKYYPHREYGNERKMSLEEWNFILKSKGLNVIESGYYQDNWHVYCVIGEEQRD